METAYIAGLIDGEGTMGIYEVKKKGKHAGWGVKFAITGTYKPMIEAVANHYGTGNFTWSKRQATIKNPYTGADLENVKQNWRWELSSKKDILVLLEDIRPYLIEKADQADIVMAYCRGDIDGETASKNCKLLKRFNWDKAIDDLHRQVV
jgi:hypothetical protein